MKKKTWRKHHKWLGLILGFFIIMFSLSGLILNHPMLFADVNISRKMLPEVYQYKQWNNGLLRGSLKWGGQVLIYGNNGIWLSDTNAVSLKDFNRGLPQGVDYRQIRRVDQTSSGQLFAAGQYGLYTYTAKDGWKDVKLSTADNEKLSDLYIKGDSVIAVGRSCLYLSTPPFRSFHQIILRPSNNDDGKVSLFRTIWLLHSGELFGTTGKLIVDLIAIIFIVLTFTGILFWFVPHIRKKRPALLLKYLFKWHNSLGKISIILTLFLCVTGWFLRPPALIAVASGKVPPMPLTTMDSNNPWHEKLRTLRYDEKKKDWLLHTSNGFYAMKHLQDVPKAELHQPMVSVMGINVEEKNKEGQWLIGSFNGMFKWDRSSNIITDYFTGEIARPTTGMPISDQAISGYSADFFHQNIVVDYNKGSVSLPMPHQMSSLPMSLRNVCIEIHTGRIYTFMGKGSLFYIFLMGLAIFWCILSGWKIRSEKKRKRPKALLRRLSLEP